MEYIVQINKFYGPFELLVYLIETNEVDIYDIPIAEITEQYIAYLDVLQEFDMAIASEFVLMASTLLEIKSKMLLPNQEKQEDPREELVNQLLEYRLYRMASEDLKVSEERESRFIAKPAEDFHIEEDTVCEQLLFEEISAYDLLYALKNVLKRSRFDTEDNIMELAKDEFTINDCIDLISEKLEILQKVNIVEIFSLHNSKKFVIAVFLSILEMSRLKNIRLVQERIFGEIFIQKA
ncbi:MAG: segregation/condensation protein A [Eubacteriales bacterium]|nr:segregation/condensation protein A [Eubacteriales bacterium]